MSAVAMFPGQDGIAIAADGVAYDDDGIVVSFATKIVHLQHLNCAMATVGSGDLHIYLQHTMGMKYADFDDLLGGISDDMRRISESPEWRLRKVFGWPVDATVGLAGWSAKRQRYEIYKISNWDKEFETLDRMKFGSSKAFELVELADFWSNTFPPPEFIEQHIIGRTITNGAEYAARWVCGCRLSSRAADPGSDEKVFGCGGFLQIALLQKDRFSSQIVHRWPDEIGKPVDPTNGELMPAWLLARPEPEKEVA